MKEEQEISLVTYIVNEQFKMLNEKILYEDIPDDGYIVLPSKKKVRWWEYYKFNNEEQYLAWKAFAIKELSKYNLQKKFDLIDMTYGLDYKRIGSEVVTNKKGQIELF